MNARPVIILLIIRRMNNSSIWSILLIFLISLMDSVYIIYLNVLFNVYLIAISIIVQFIVYPSFNKILESFTEYHSRYKKKIFWIVGPVMILEILTSLLMILNEFDIYLIPGLIVLLLWMLTFIYIVPVSYTHLTLPTICSV